MLRFLIYLIINLLDLKCETKPNLAHISRVASTCFSFSLGKNVAILVGQPESDIVCSSNLQLLKMMQC